MLLQRESNQACAGGPGAHGGPAPRARPTKARAPSRPSPGAPSAASPPRPRAHAGRAAGPRNGGALPAQLIQRRGLAARPPEGRPARREAGARGAPAHGPRPGRACPPAPTPPPRASPPPGPPFLAHRAQIPAPARARPPRPEGRRAHARAGGQRNHLLAAAAGTPRPPAPSPGLQPGPAADSTFQKRLRARLRTRKMAEAQFKCPETQPTPARAEGGRSNGASPLPRGLARARTPPAWRPHPLASRAGRGWLRGRQGRSAHARLPRGRAPARACANVKEALPAAASVTELGGAGLAVASCAGNAGERPTQSPWSCRANTGTAVPGQAPC